jgi:hypothetical protein
MGEPHRLLAHILPAIDRLVQRAELVVQLLQLGSGGVMRAVPNEINRLLAP